MSGRLASGVTQVGEKLRVLPGDETAVVKSVYLVLSHAITSSADDLQALILTMKAFHGQWQAQVSPLL